MRVCLLNADAKSLQISARSIVIDTDALSESSTVADLRDFLILLRQGSDWEDQINQHNILALPSESKTKLSELQEVKKLRLVANTDVLKDLCLPHAAAQQIE